MSENFLGRPFLAVVGACAVASLFLACSSDPEKTTEFVLTDSGSADTSTSKDALADSDSDAESADTGADSAPVVPPVLDAGVGLVASFNGTAYAFNVATSASRNPSSKAFHIEGRTGTTPFRAVQFDINVNDAGAITCSGFNTVTAVEGSSTFQASSGAGSCAITISSWPEGVGQAFSGTFSATAPEVGGSATLVITDGKFDIASSN